MEQKVEDWAFLRSKTKSRFDSVEALTLLQELGLVKENPDRQVKLAHTFHIALSYCAAGLN